MLTFSDLRFIFRIFPILVLIYYITPTKLRAWVLLIGSIALYAVGEPYFVLLLLGLTVLNYLLGKGVHALRGGGRKFLLALALLLDIGALATFKVLGTYVDSAFLPVGISFYCFKMISYQADLYRGKMVTRPSFRDTALYFCFFAQILQGPVTRFDFITHNHLWRERHYAVSEKEHRKKVLEDVDDGLRYFILGLSMKILLADHLAMLWNQLKTIGFETISTPLAWLGAYGYSLELYFDFWGYSLMAAGLGVMLGFPFVKNFDQPYGACGVADFYRRWHITLGMFLRDYVYFPLGGSRCGKIRTIFNLLVVWIITGIWHGLTPNFLIWGLTLFFLIVMEKFLWNRWKFTRLVMGHFHVLVLIPLTWVVFAIPDLTELGFYMMRLFPFWGHGISVNPLDFSRYGVGFFGFFITGLILLIPGVYRLMVNNRKKPVMSVILFTLFWLCVYSLCTSAGNPFMYLKF
jgi:alginate O-acetyltransferase complex protein AlgI